MNYPLSTTIILSVFALMAQGADLTIFADAEFTPRDIDPPDDGIADVFVAGQPETYKYLFIKAGTEDRACAEFPLDTSPSCTPAKAELHFFIRTLDDNLYPADPIEVKWYEGNGLPDLADYNPVDGQIAVVFDGPVQDLLNTNGCPRSVHGNDYRRNQRSLSRHGG